MQKHAIPNCEIGHVVSAYSGYMAEKRIALERWAAHLAGLEAQPLDIAGSTTTGCAIASLSSN